MSARRTSGYGRRAGARAILSLLFSACMFCCPDARGQLQASAAESPEPEKVEPTDASQDAGDADGEAADERAPSEAAPDADQTSAAEPASDSDEGEGEGQGESEGEGDEEADDTDEKERDTDISPLDFCALEPKAQSSSYQRQRVVMLDVAEDPSLRNGPEVELVERGKDIVEVPRQVFQGIQPFGHAREVLLTVVPMKRLYLVLSSATPNGKLKAKGDVSLADAQAAVADDRWAAYSLVCADWLVAPYMTRDKVRWSKVKKTKTVTDKNGKSHEVEYMAWDVSVDVDLRFEVYRRQGDQYRHYRTLEGSSGSLRSLVSRSAEHMAWNNTSELYSHVSVGLPLNCPLPSAGGSGAFNACGGVKLDFSVEGKPSPGVGQSSGPFCSGLDEAVSGGSGMPALATCALRKAAESATLEIQLEAKRMCGWSLFSALLDLPGKVEQGITMGEYEGARRGDYYIAYRAGGSCMDDTTEPEELGFARITRLGSGGDQGEQDPSFVKFRGGEAEPGARMTEYAMHGARIGVEPVVAFFYLDGDMATSIAVGGTGRLGYDLSRFIPFFDEIWSVGSFGALGGSESEVFLTYDLGLEGVEYLAGRLAFIGGVGFGGTSASKSVDNPTMPAGAEDESVSLSGSVFALQARLGLEYAIRPEWNARLMLETRSGFKNATLKNDEAPDLEVDAGTLTGSSAAASIAYTF